MADATLYELPGHIQRTHLMRLPMGEDCLLRIKVLGWVLRLKNEFVVTSEWINHRLCVICWICVVSVVFKLFIGI
jgi:hypothetical protein